MFEYQAFASALDGYRMKLRQQMQQKLRMERMRIEQYQTKLQYLHPSMKLKEWQQHSVEMQKRMQDAMTRQLVQKRNRLELYIERMKGLSPLMKLNQGYSYVSTKEGKHVRSISDVEKNDALTIYVTDGMVYAKVEDTIKEDYRGKSIFGRSI